MTASWQWPSLRTVFILNHEKIVIGHSWWWSLTCSPGECPQSCWGRPSCWRGQTRGHASSSDCQSSLCRCHQTVTPFIDGNQNQDVCPFFLDWMYTSQDKRAPGAVGAPPRPSRGRAWSGSRCWASRWGCLTSRWSPRPCSDPSAPSPLPSWCPCLWPDPWATWRGLGWWWCPRWWGNPRHHTRSWSVMLRIVKHDWIPNIYSRGGINWAKSLGAHIFHHKACKPINLGAKWKPLISSFQNYPWIWDLNLNWLSYGLEKERNLNLENSQNESSLLK